MSEEKKGKRRSYLERAKVIPGIQQAFGLIMLAATRASIGNNGEINQNKYREITVQAIKKVSELWELSPAMEQYLIQRWVDAKEESEVGAGPGESMDFGYLFRDESDKSKDRGQDLELEIVLTGEEKGDSEIESVDSELADLEARLITPKEMRRGHIYLDVTVLDYKGLRDAYPVISRCRDMLGIDTSDIKRGAPESMDFRRALLAARAEQRGLSRKEIAKILGFKIYRQDIPSGTYPLFQKHLKVGKWISCRMDKLEEYLHELTGIDTDTL